MIAAGEGLNELAHRLKTPLAVIVGFAELLLTREDAETRIEAARHIAEAGRRLGAELDELLGLEAATGAEPAGDERRCARQRPARVVVIDDDVFVRRLLRTTLPTEGFEIAEAADGEIALALADVQRPDLVLLDWRMPNLSGDSVLAELKRRFPGLPVVVLTVDGSQQARATELGADAFLTKPFSPLEVLRTVDALVPGRTSLEGSA